MDQAARRYVALTLAGKDALLMAHDHAHRRELCRRIRGELTYLGVVSPGPSVTIADGQQASVGDLIVCTHNDHTTPAGEPGRMLANGDLLRIEQITNDGIMVRRALDVDPQTGRRRWTGHAFPYPRYQLAEPGYAVTDHAAQSRTVHTGMQLITGSETRQQAYVGISRGTHTNIAFVFTVTPKLADPAPGPRPAPELARAGQLHTERTGQVLPPAEPAGREATGVLADVVARDGAELSALETLEQSFSSADNLAILHAQWQAETSTARAGRWRELLMRTLPEQYRGELGHQSKWLWRTLRSAELAGLDPEQVLTTAIGERDLAGARDVASVIDARIRQRTAGMVPLRSRRGASASPRSGPIIGSSWPASPRRWTSGRSASANTQPNTGRPGPPARSGRCPPSRWTGWPGSARQHPSAPAASCPDSATRTGRSGPSPTAPTQTCGRPGTKRSPAWAQPTVWTSVAFPTGPCT